MSPEELQALKDAKDRAYAEYVHAGRRAREAEEAYTLALYGVVIGDDVISENKRYRVTSVDGRWLRGFQYKKDGTLGTGDRVIYNPQPLPIETGERL